MAAPVVESTNYPDTTRILIVGEELTPGVASTNLHLINTVNEPAHTLTNGLIILQENTDSRVKDAASARGRRGSSLRVQTHVRLNELGLWYDSAIGPRTTTAMKDATTQTVTINGVPTGGTFVLSYRGEITAPLAYNATAAAVQTALQALSTVGAGGITVTGSAGGPYTVTLVNETAGYGADLLFAFAGKLTGGTNPSITIVPAGSTITAAYRHTWIGGKARGVSLTVYFFNGLYWRRMTRMRVNTMNLTTSGADVPMVDMELVGPPGVKFNGTFPAYDQDDSYLPLDAPTEFVRIAGVIDTDMDRMAVNLSNNLTNRSTMARSAAIGRTRFGNFDIALDGMADYPQYAGSYYEAFETNRQLGQADVCLVDDLSLVGSGTTINPYLQVSMPRPLLADTAEGSDSGELVQMIRGRARPSLPEGGNVVVNLVNSKDATYYQPA